MTNEAARPTTVLTDRYAKAVAYTSQLHANQTRKTTSISYISHLLGVSSLVFEACGKGNGSAARLGDTLVTQPV